MSKEKAIQAQTPTRRKFLTGAAAATAGAAITGFPMISVAQSPIVLKMQGAWGAKDIFNEMAEEYVKRVNEMAGGRLRIDYLVAGSVVKPFEVMDATHKGVIDGAHSVAVYWYGKSKIASLFGTGPITGCDAAQALAWIHKQGGPFYEELMQKLGLNVVSFYAMPMPTQPLGWFKKPIKNASQLKGFKYRTVGLAADLMQELGMKVTQLPGGEIVPAMERGVIDAFEFNNPTSDRRFGAQDVAKNYMMGSYHQAMEFFEIIFNKKKYQSLPKDLQAVLRYAAEAASTSNYATAMDNYSKDLQELKTKDKVNVIRTPQGIFDVQLKAWDKLVDRLTKEDPLFKKTWESQKAWAKRVAYYSLFNSADYKAGYEHVFGKLGF
ncbi:MAG: C4-dicarboxylate ABC transporter [Betaproteobacteria bacterium RIFCSPLOWO2_12_FULL_63_13]|nr:MAG: C4-dicarboxylate ABC transporter [Betaproteobacteria bacterium RIFCSPLOWO2_02_FULL_63_19]OGA48695.1 MAG: C4-dicarboxylate ABC transporter [Betaproteobacteria bacterium RIFCSPLOWO2_12_FULL_63_13]